MTDHTPTRDGKPIVGAPDATAIGSRRALPRDVIELQPVAFSAKVVAHGRHPTNLARMDSPDGYALQTGWCGELMEMYLRLDGDRIGEASFWADGCLSTMACADVVTTMARGMSPEDAAKITPEELIEALDGLPYASEHCAGLAVETIRAAVAALRREDGGRGRCRSESNA